MCFIQTLRSLSFREVAASVPTPIATVFRLVVGEVSEVAVVRTWMLIVSIVCRLGRDNDACLEEKLLEILCESRGSSEGEVGVCAGPGC